MLPELAAGSFVGSNPYAYMLLGCEADPSASLPAECAADAAGTLPAAGVSTLRGRVVALDDGTVDEASIGLQFIRNSFHVDPTNGAPGKLRALATGGYNDGPKAIGGALAAFDPPASDSNAAAAIGVDGVKVLTSFARGTFELNRSYMVTMLGCTDPDTFANTPWTATGTAEAPAAP